MSALLLYLVTTAAFVALWRRYVQRFSVAAAIVLVLMPLCFTGRAILTGKIYAPVDLPFMSEPLSDYKADFGITGTYNGTMSDLYCQIMPWRKAVRHAIGQGEWPLLNPFMLCGDILAQAAQAAPYDPVNLLGLLIPMAPSLTFGAAMTFFLAGFFTFAFARALGLAELASLVAAAGFMFGAMLAFFVGWPLSRAWSYMPLVMLGVRVVVHERNTKGVALLTAGFVTTIFAGHPESILHIVAVGAAYGAFELLRTRAWRAIPLAILAGVLALGLSAIFLLPFLDAVPQTVEHKVRTEHFAKTDFPTIPELIAKRAGVTFFPWFGGSHRHDNFTPLWDAQSARVGSIILALAFAALVLAPRKKETWFFLGLALFCLCATLDAPPVAHLLHELPLFDIALNERLALAATFAFAILAGIAVDAWRRARAAALVVASVAVILGIATSLLWDGHRALGVRTDLLVSMSLAELIPLAIIAALLASRVSARTAVPVVLALLLVQRTMEDGDLYPALAQELFYPRVPVLEAIPQKASEPFRVVGLHFALIPDTAAFYELEDVRGYQAMTYERLAATYSTWSFPQAVSFNAVADASRPFLSLANVRYALSPGDAQPPEGWRLVVRDRTTSLWENERFLSRAFVPNRIRYEGQDAKVLEGMETATDFGDVSWILAPEVGPHEMANGPGALTVRQDGLGLDIDANMAGDGWVVISQSGWNGWRAYLDGKRVNTKFANHAFLGVFVPKGVHNLKLTYLPPSFTRGRTISAATLLAIVALLMWRNRESMRRILRT